MGQSIFVFRVDDQAHNFFPTVKRRAFVFSGFQVKQEYPLPAAATKYGFLVPKAERRNVEILDIRRLVEFLYQTERIVLVTIKVNLVFDSE